MVKKTASIAVCRVGLVIASEKTASTSHVFCNGWALKLASSCGFEKVIVESDAKNCIEDLSGHPDSSNWRISVVSSQSLDLVSCFSYCKFQQVRHDVNQMAHSPAKISLTLELPLYCNKTISLHLLKELGLEICSLCFNENHI